MLGEKQDDWEVQKPWKRKEEEQNQKREDLDSKYKERIFIPHTPDTTLKHKLNEMEKKLNFLTSLKYCDKMGCSVSGLLVRKTLHQSIGNIPPGSLEVQGGGMCETVAV